MNYREELKKILVADAKIYDETLLSKNIVLYGAGALGRMAIDLLKRAEINDYEIVDKKLNVLDGKNVKKLNELTIGCKKNSLFLVTICTIPYNDIEKELRDNGVENIMQFYTYAYIKMPQLLSNGWFVHDIFPDIEEGVMQVFDLLKHHEFSIRHYLQFCWWKMREKEVVSEAYKVLSGKKYFNAPIMPLLNRDEVFLDCGCYNGCVIEQFIEKVDGVYKKIYAFEPDKASLKTAKENLVGKDIVFDSRALGRRSETRHFQNDLGFASKLLENGSERVEVVSVDELHIKPSIIKLHVEGSELDVLEGAIKTIEQNRPIIMVFADHNSDGLVKIPQFVNKLKDYKLYFLLHDYCGNSAIYYMIPKERDIRVLVDG